MVEPPTSKGWQVARAAALFLYIAFPHLTIDAILQRAWATYAFLHR